MRYLIASLCLLSGIWALPAPAFAGGDSPRAAKTEDPIAAKTGTNVKGESGDFATYLNEDEGEEKESNSVDLVDLGDDAKIAAGGDDSSVGLKMGY